jgi:5'-methylthioadenosine phosphorylase
VTDQILAVIGGSGIGETFSARSDTTQVEVDTPFGPHSRPILKTQIDGVTCLFLSRHGQGHIYNPSTVPYRANIFALKALGATQIIATGATGSLREDIAPGQLVICDQVIDRTVRRESTFFDDGIVAHVELSQPFCGRLSTELRTAGNGIDCKIHDGGTYVCMEGPQFSTRAESMLHVSWGADLIGMTCMPEAKLAREAELCYALIALPTDYDCWRPHQPGADKKTLLNEIISNMKTASQAAVTLIDRAIKHLAQLGPTSCDCHDALQLAIWSDKSKVAPEAIQKLKPLVGRYFLGG